MTKTDFDQLPMLIHRQQVLDITGWSKKTFNCAIEEGIIKPAVTMKRRRYFSKLQMQQLLSSVT